ncbi:MAG: choice-of-anchor Q domain-containing protein [Chloroflexota bacterium]
MNSLDQRGSTRLDGSCDIGAFELLSNLLYLPLVMKG